MATGINYNDFGTMMVENRPTMLQLDADEMSRNEWKKYLNICDNVAKTAYEYMNNREEAFNSFRSAVHSLYTFIGYDTRILSIDGYTVRFIPAVCPYKVVKSKEYRNAEKAIRIFKKAREWACIESEADINNPDAVLFPMACNMQEFAGKYYNHDIEDYYNAVVGIVKTVFGENRDVLLSDLDTELSRLESIKVELGNQPWHCYKDFKNPMLSAQGKALKHAPMSIRKAIEDTMADILTARSLMTSAQLEMEEAQIAGGNLHKKQLRNKERKQAQTESK